MCKYPCDLTVRLRSPAAERSAQLETALGTVGPSCGGDEGFLLRKYLLQSLFYFGSSLHRFSTFICLFLPYVLLFHFFLWLFFLSLSLHPFFSFHLFLSFHDILFIPLIFSSSLILRFLSSIVLFLFCCFFVALFVNFSCFLFPRAFFSYFLSSPSPANFCTHFDGVMKPVLYKAFRPLV